MKIAVIGGGIFGLTIAPVLAKEGFSVDVYEKEDDVFKMASGINQFRLHRGYHYPRSTDTINECLSGEVKFRKFYPEVVIDEPHEHYYAIAKEDSLFSAEQCFKVWSECGLKYEITDLDILNKDSIEKCVKVREAIIDPVKFKAACLERCKRYGVNIILGKKVSYEDLHEYDMVVSATYANSNIPLKAFPEAQENYQFELIEKLVLDLPEKFRNMSVVIQDGPFTCIDPYGESGLSLMGNVTHAIHHRNIGKVPEIPEQYRELLNNGIIKNPKITKVSSFLKDAEKFFPGIRDGAKHIRSMFTIRTVLPYREHDDARPTTIREINDRLISVFSGKIPTCVEAAEQVLRIVKSKQERKSTTIGIIGMGKWGKALLRVFDKLSEVKVCVNKDDVSNQEFIRKHYPKIRTSFDYDDILNDDSIDAVVIATPIKTHFEIAKKFIKKGKAVFLEKPLAENLRDAKELIDISKGKFLFVGHTFLYSPGYKMIKELVLDDPVVEIETTWNKMGTFKEDIFLNLVSHDLSIVSGLLEKSPTGVELTKNESVISKSDRVSIDLKFDSGETCKINIDRTSPQKRKEVKVKTVSGKVYYWIDNKIMKLDRENKRFDILFDSEKEPLREEVKEFLENLRNNQEPIVNKNIALNVMKILERIE